MHATRTKIVTPVPARPSSLVGALLVLLWSTTVGAAPPPVATDHAGPLDGAAGRVVDEAVRALRSSSAETYLAFVAEHAVGGFRDEIPPDRHRAFWWNVRGDTGRLSYHGYRTYDPPRPADEHTAILRDSYGGWWGLRLVLDGADPPRVTGLELLPARPPSNVPPAPRLSLRDAVGALDSYIDMLVREELFAGTVLLARDGNVVYERAAGEASRRFHVANTMDTKFNIGSMNKMFTAVAILQLAGEGRLALDDPLSAHLDESWLPAAIADRVRIRHCLNHTSGLGSYFTDDFWRASRERFRTVDDFKPLVVGETLAFEPGTAFRYSNTGFLLLGAVIERVTQHAYTDWIMKRVHLPARMTSTDCYAMDEPVEDLAIGYVPAYDSEGRRIWRNNLFLHVIRGGPAGGGYSTVKDLLAFDRALRDGRLLPDALRDELWRARPEAASPDYGYGFAVEEGPERLGTIVGHSGGFPGLNGRLDMCLDTGWTIVVLSNLDRGAERVADRARLMLERTIE